MVKARKRFAQHFLEPAWVVKLVDAIAPAARDRFIEIGPGRGAITMPLAARAASVLAIEIDRDLAADLRLRVPANVTVVDTDVLAVDLADLAQRITREAADASGPVRVVGNLPYNISSPILIRLLSASAGAGFRDATLMLQKEVADRLVAEPSTREYGVLTLSTRMRADVTTLLALPPGAFRPAPKVRSSVVRLDFRPPPSTVHDPELVTRIVRSAFTQRRKTLSNALTAAAAARGLAAAEVLHRADIDPRRRPETLALDEWARIADVLAAS